MAFVDLRDRYGITQLAFNNDVMHEFVNKQKNLGVSLSFKQKVLLLKEVAKTKTYQLEKLKLMFLN